jgi:DNA-sulfur modification-associated
MTSADAIRILDSVDTPEGLVITVISNPADFFNRPVVLNKQSNYWFGSAMKQGNRLQFLTTMPMNDYLSIVGIDQAPRGSSVKELTKHPNRPNVPNQRTAIKGYLKETAFVGDKWIFPNFMLNYGVGWTEESPKAELILLVTDNETLAWPAIFIPPTGARLPASDGAHRSGSLDDLVKARGEGIDVLLANGVGCTFVFEASSDMQHQDFTDLAKSKPVTESVKATWDLRNIVVKAARGLVLGNTFLHQYVDATSPSVNLSSNSTLIWSMSAVRGSLINAFCARIEDFDKLTQPEKTKLLADAPVSIGAFFDELVARVPIFQQLMNGSSTPAVFRKQLGGCVLMRGAGFGILMRAFRYATTNSISLADMADYLAKVDWFLLPFDWTDQLASTVTSPYDFLRDNAKPAWFKMVAVNAGSNTWRLKGTNENLDAAFQVLMAPAVQAKAAE